MSYFILFTGILTAYLIGSIPTAYIFGRLLKGIDIRQFGSGNVGATNAFRVMGRTPALSVLVIDILKGFISTAYIAGAVLYLSPVSRVQLYRVLVGLSSIIGHNWPVFLRFRGGKGVATSAGVVMGLIPKIFLLGLSVWSVVFFITGYVSVASIFAAFTVPLFALVFGESIEIVVFISLLSIMLVYRHKSNIRRLRRGEEKRIELFKKR